MSLASQLSPDRAQSVIYTQLLNDGIPDPLATLVTAQSGHETNGWTSNVFLQNNNAFGYGFTGSSYKAYDSVEASADELAAYLGRRVADGSFPDLSTITTADQYAALLKQAGYYGDTTTNYAAGIARWFAANIPLASGTLGIIAAGLLFWYLAK